ncbi:MAG: T9SS type A sorting domain-containing protein [Flavobacterium sp.]|uniref:T9SS type A sorting domain-containing protein n=1 Tax=Flavobacterium sp. TaxID=239 RepID=UPI0025C0B71B|nr:T9SS type A sorting domain-containing protein [Flavobacterium sp.]MCK6609303.1 T9SS type A sorting domain-containing protein [Flavobacterium sp.]
MKNKHYLFLVIGLFSITNSIAQDILWERSYGGKHAEYLFDAIPTADYGFILAGSSISNKNGNKSEANKGDLDYWIWKMDEKGTPEWQKSFGGTGVDILYSVKNTNDGGFILAGTSSSNKSEDKKDDSKGQEDFWVIKLDAKGKELWQRTIGGTSQEKLLSVAQTKDGGFVLGGSSSSNKTLADSKGKLDEFGKAENSKGNLDYWVVKLDIDGKVEWNKAIGGKYVDELKSIEQTEDEGYILGGYSNSPVSGDKAETNVGQGDYWVVKLNKNGLIQWQRTLGGDKDDNLFALTQTKDKGFIVGGSSNSSATDTKNKTSKNGTDFWIVKLDEIGNVQWQEAYDYGKYDMLSSIVENPDGTFLIGGYAQSEFKSKSTNVKGLKTTKKDEEGINDYIALKIKDNGEEIWTQTVGSNGDEVLKRLFETRDGGYILAGTSNGTISRDKNSMKGRQDFWIVKLKDKDKKDKEKQNIEAIPNPASSYTNAIIGYDYKDGTVTLYDLNGRSLQTIKVDGERTVPVNLSGLPQGVYIIEVKTDVSKDGVKVIKK